MPIRKLSESLVLKIAAGEVVERPASVVKELLENSIDAGATRIEIRIAGGGLERITITDDGCGIPENEIRLALERHATSKIATEQDLFRIGTLGFRGEALPSIAAVSHFEIVTRPRESASAYCLRAEGGEVRVEEPAGGAPGTTITVSNLFYNVPARKKFLRTSGTEFGQIEKTVRRIALARPDLELSLDHNGETILRTPRAQNLTDRISALYNKEVSSQIHPIGREEGSLRVSGIVSNPRVTFGRAQEFWFFVNGRPIQDRMLQSAVMEGYRTLLMEHRWPLAVISLAIPPELVDVNVHPAKSEVRFADGQAIFRLVSRAIAEALAPQTRFTPRETSPAFPSQHAQFGYAQSAAPVVARDESTLYVSDSKVGGGFEGLRYLGSLDKTYLLLTDDETLFVIDQHAAHERVRFEELRKAFASKKAPSQKLLLPITIELTAERESALDGITPFLTAIGFELEEFGPRSHLIRSVPASLGATDPATLLTDLCDDLLAEGGVKSWSDRTDELLSRLACHSAVRAHDDLAPGEIDRLLRDMGRVDLSAHCPHGRPTFVTFAATDFERFFKRT
ncbi:MAG: DNA mismatch repair endonuclease MutL [Pseudomonadota bacterium]